jgi:hypothetical protein
MNSLFAITTQYYSTGSATTKAAPLISVYSAPNLQNNNHRLLSEARSPLSTFNRTFLCANRTGICANRTGICANRTTICADRTSICADRTGICADRTGICADRTGICADRTSAGHLRSFTELSKLIASKFEIINK